MSTISVIFHRIAVGSGGRRLGSYLVACSWKVYIWVVGMVKFDEKQYDFSVLEEQIYPLTK